MLWRYIKWECFPCLWKLILLFLAQCHFLQYLYIFIVKCIYRSGSILFFRFPVVFVFPPNFSKSISNYIKTDATSGAATAYPSGFYWGSCYSIFSFMCMFCGSLFVLLYFFFWPLYCLFFFFWPLYCLFFFFWPLYCLFFFDIRILITPLVLQTLLRNNYTCKHLIWCIRVHCFRNLKPPVLLVNILWRFSDERRTYDQTG